MTAENEIKAYERFFEFSIQTPFIYL